MLDLGMKKGSATLLILSLIEHEARHGYDLAKRIASLSRNVLKFHVASLYPLLYRLEDRGLIEGRWVEKAGQLEFPRWKVWIVSLVVAIGRVTGKSHA